MGLSGLTLGTATPAAAAPASAGEVTIPAPPHATPATEYLYAAGTGVQTLRLRHEAASLAEPRGRTGVP